MTGWGKKKKGEGNEGEKEEDVKVGKKRMRLGRKWTKEVKTT